jgi:putative phosphoesterase
MGFALNRRIERLMTPTRRIPSGGGFFINPRESTAGFCLRDEDSLRLHRLFPCAVTGPWAGLEIYGETMSKLLILSDIHANWPALQAVVNAEPDYDMAVFCGDLVDYGPSPVACLHWVRKHCAHVVRGNHDNALAFDLDCHCMGSFRVYSRATRAWHHRLLGDDDVQFLRQMPVVDWFEWNGRHFRMAHATPQGGLFQYLSPDEWQDYVDGMDADFILLGHTHVQGARSFERLTVVNPGSVGLARDRAGEACYAIFEGGTLTLKRIPYDVSETIRELRRSPLQRDIVEGLTGVLRPASAADRLAVPPVE